MELMDIKGIGEARVKSFAENDIFSYEDLANYFPYKYYDFSKTMPYADDGIVKLIKATVIENAKVVKIRGNFSFVSCKMNDEVGHSFTAMWFNQTFIKSQLFLGAEVYLYGKNSPTKKNTFVVQITKFADKFQNFGYLSVYHKLGSIGQKVLHDTINEILKTQKFSTFVPNSLLQKYNLMDLNDAYFQIHNRDKFTNIEECFERVELEKIIPMLAINDYNRFVLREKKEQHYKVIDGLLQEFEGLLPFKLTLDQRNACHALENDFKSCFAMNRMIQGDVGSGKTVVAMFGAYVAAKNGYQSAIIAPTELLAKQHFDYAKKLFYNHNINVVCLTSSLSSHDKHIVIEKITSGSANIVIGTHSIISDSVVFKNLSFACVDEQHRFGVEQRKMLKNKGITPDILVMSATPIPRTLGLIMFGDLDITKIIERPKPAKITTNIVIQSKQNSMWEYINQKISCGSKVYVVCSKIDEDNDDDSILKFSAKNMFEFLKTKFPESKLGLIHGKMSKDAQSKTIKQFRIGEIKILVSTTIVEVGMDIPDSDIMVIATPERFGLATLHQLRGRIGRNGEESYCFCLADNLNEKSYDRILYFKNHLNGFEIAEYDLKTRGIGSMIGTNQHGDDNGMMATIFSNNYSKAREILEQIKTNIPLYTKVLEKGQQLSKNNILDKVILN